MMRRAPAFLLVPLLAACATGRAVTPVVTAGPSTRDSGPVLDTTWYVTNRARQSNTLVRAAGDSLEFGFIVSRYRDNGSASRFLGDISASVTDSVRLTREAFIERLRGTDSAAALAGDGTIMYVHGYAVSFGHAIRQGADIQHRGSHRGPMVVFAWPAHANIVTWPSKSAIVSRAYRDDLIAAEQSRAAFREAVDVVRHAVRSPSFTIVGHSMGSQLVTEALAAPSPLRDSLSTAPLGALVLFAADLGVARFRDSLATPLRAVTNRRILYSSDDDFLMGISRRLNHEERVGQAIAARKLGAAGVEVVDVTDGLRARYGVRRIFEPGHAMRNASAALYDFFGVVRGVPADCREASGIVQKSDDGTWRISSAPIPAEPMDPQSCASLK